MNKINIKISIDNKIISRKVDVLTPVQAKVWRYRTISYQNKKVEVCTYCSQDEISTTTWEPTR